MGKYADADNSNICICIFKVQILFLVFAFVSYFYYPHLYSYCSYYMLTVFKVMSDLELEVIIHYFLLLLF
jgi:hypothetical protein